MFKFFSALHKEMLILVRDISGLIVLFIMPMIMVIILSIVQEFGWNAITKEPQIPVLFVNEDHDSLATMIGKGLEQTRIFQLVSSVKTQPITRMLARDEVRKGNYQIGVVIPKGATQIIQRKIKVLVTQVVSGIMMPMNNPFLEINSNDSVNIIIFFDPAIKGTFKNAFMSSMREFSLKIESAMIFTNFYSELQRMFPQFHNTGKGYQESVHFTEVFPSGQKAEIIPNSTQHNVPSWAIFAMFFIIIPLTSSIIKEREEGSLIRLHTLPVNYMTIFLAKVGVYVVVCFIQFLLMVLAGIFILPLFGMPSLNISGHYIMLIVLAIVTSMAALGFGIMVGTIARTHQQASAFGSVSIVILAAMGGLWVPVYLMPTIMRTIASFSPLNWAQSGFMTIFLRGGQLQELFPEIIKLFIFFAFTIGIAGIYRTIKPPIGD